MKTIIIATDFSETSYNAVKYGFSLAERIGTKVILFHAYQTAISIPEAYSVVTSEELKLAAEKELNRLSDELRLNSEQIIESIAVEGNVEDMILLYAKKYEDCLIICGKKNKGKFTQKLFGNTSMELINKSNIPLLIIPEGFVFNKIKKIVFATDLSLDTDIRTLKPLLNIGEKNDAKLVVLRVMAVELNVLEEINFRSERLNSYLKVLDPHYVFLKSDDISNTIEKYLEENNVDMIALMPRHHTIMEKIFSSSESKKILFLTNLPILYLPEVKIKYIDVKKGESQMQA